MTEFPTGYSLKSRRLCSATLIFPTKNGVTLRQAPKGTLTKGMPVWFRPTEIAGACEYVRRHAELGLEPNQEVPGFNF